MRDRPLAIVSDFDGTIVTADLGDEVAKRCAPPEAWREFERDWLSGRLTLIEAQRRIWPLVRATAEEFATIVDEAALFRPGFERLFAAAAVREVPFVIASSGFSNYIERVMARAPAITPRAVYANRLVFEGNRLEPEFPFAGRLGCSSCELCKGKVIDELKAEGYRIAYTGDGLSDRCAAGRADELFAVAGKSLERWLKERSIPHRSFESFDEVGAALGL